MLRLPSEITDSRPPQVQRSLLTLASISSNPVMDHGRSGERPSAAKSGRRRADARSRRATKIPATTKKATAKSAAAIPGARSAVLGRWRQLETGEEREPSPVVVALGLGERLRPRRLRFIV